MHLHLHRAGRSPAPLLAGAMEAIVFGGRKVVVPAALEGMRDLTVTLGGVAL